MKFWVRVIRVQEPTNRFDDLARVLGDVTPREPDNPPSVKQRLPITLPVPREGIGEFVPPSRVPLDGEAFAREGHIEPPGGIPRNRKLESWLGQASNAE